MLSHYIVFKNQEYKDCTSFLRYKVDPELHELLQQMCKIQEICYANEFQRTVTSICRFLNLTFIHAVSDHKLLGKPRASGADGD